MSISDKLEDGLEKLADIVELLADPPALEEIEIDHPQFPNPAGAGTFYHTMPFTVKSLDPVEIWCGVSDENANNVWTPQNIWNPATKLVFTENGLSSVQFPDSANWHFRVDRKTTSGALARPFLNAKEPVISPNIYTEDPAYGFNTGNQNGQAVKYLKLLNTEWKPGVEIGDSGHCFISRSSSIVDVLDMALYWPTLSSPNIDTSGLMPNWVQDMMDDLTDEVNVWGDLIFESITDTLIELAVKLIDFINQFIYKKIVRDFLLKWVVYLLTYGLRVLVALPSYLIGEWVLDSILPALDAKNIRRPLEAIISSFDLPALGAEVGSAEFINWAASALGVMEGKEEEGMKSVSFSDALQELMRSIGSMSSKAKEYGSDD